MTSRETAKWTGIGLAGVGLAAFVLTRKARRVPQVLDPRNAAHQRWLANIDAFIFDIDGVLYTGTGPIPGAAQAIASLKAAGKQVRYLTNNSAKTPAAVVATFKSMGIAAEVHEVTNSAMVAAEYVKANVPPGSKVYAIGEPPLFKMLSEVGGVECFGGESENFKAKDEWQAEKLTLDTLQPKPSEVAAVIVGSDAKVNYYKLTKAGAYLRGNPSARFVGTNPDPIFTLAPGGVNATTGEAFGPTFGPGAGLSINTVSSLAGREPEIICGKPSVPLGKFMLEHNGFDASRTCMVGDRLDTDIQFGRSAGMQTLFVESGTMTRAAAMDPANSPERTTDFIAPSIASLAAVLEATASI